MSVSEAVWVYFAAVKVFGKIFPGTPNEQPIFHRLLSGPTE
jgi:hypothetical protein